MLRQLPGLFAVSCFALTGRAQPTVQPTIAVEHVNIVDVIAGDIRNDQTVLISNGKITVAGAAAGVTPPPDARVISAQGKYLLPGLWDMHVHLRSDENKPDIRLAAENESMLDLFLPNGIVGIREMGGDLADQVIQWRKEIRAGKRSGPRIITAGRKIDNNPPAWAGSIGVANQDEARQAVRQIMDSGADFVKVYFRNVAPETFRATVEEAHRLHLKVTGHKPNNMSIQELIETGLDEVQHQQYLPATSREQYDALWRERSSRDGKPWSMEATEVAARLLAFEDEKESARVYRLMAERQFWVTPTVAVDTHALEHGVRDYESDYRKRYFFAAIWDTWDPKKGVRRPLVGRALALRQAATKRWEEATLAAFKAGVPMLLGTDCGANNDHTMPGWAAHEEMEALVRIGLTPADVLRMATVNAAKWRGDADEGTVEPGKVADLLLIRSNPLTDIRHTHEVDSVFQGGRYYSRSALDEMLQAAEARVAAATKH
jgi:imidazolonepropionase-like amidohydrolase